MTPEQSEEALIKGFIRVAQRSYAEAGATVTDEEIAKLACKMYVDFLTNVSISSHKAAVPSVSVDWTNPV